MRLSTLIITLPVALVLIAVAVANRGPVLLSFDPFAQGTPALAVEMPLYLALFACLFLGIVIGGIVAWIAGLKRRLALKRASKALARDLAAAPSAAETAGRPSQP